MGRAVHTSSCLLYDTQQPNEIQWNSQAHVSQNGNFAAINHGLFFLLWNLLEHENELLTTSGNDLEVRCWATKPSIRNRTPGLNDLSVTTGLAFWGGCVLSPKVNWGRPAWNWWVGYGGGSTHYFYFLFLLFYYLLIIIWNCSCSDGFF